MNIIGKIVPSSVEIKRENYFVIKRLLYISPKAKDTKIRYYLHAKLKMKVV